MNESYQFFDGIKPLPLDPILGITITFNRDTRPEFPQDGSRPFKLNLGVGTYRGSDGKPVVLNVVKKAEKELAEAGANGDLIKDYLPVEGLRDFYTASASLLFGPEYETNQSRIFSMQTLSGTGALRIAATVILTFMPRTIYLPIPSYKNHKLIFPQTGLPIRYYRYLSKDGVIDFEGMFKDIKKAPPGSVFLFHMCAHNPTGVDPSHEQWKDIATIIKECRHYVIFDCAYQGFASGDVDQDAFAPRHFLSRGMQFMTAHSYSKSMSLYCERVGCLSIVCANKEIADNMLSQAKSLARGSYSNPPAHGARVAATVLNTPQLRAEWNAEVKGMAERILNLRKTLHDELGRLGTPGNWGILLRQKGLFSLLPLTAEQVELLKNKHHIYMMSDGRANLAGLGDNVVQYFAKCLDDVVRETGQAPTTIQIAPE